jgi:hypothetical protein
MSNQMTCQLEVKRELAQPEELNQNLVKKTDCKENKCLINIYSKDCRAFCEVENGYCVYEEIEFIRECKFEYYIEHFYPGENIEEKYNHYYYDCFEREESWGSNFNDDEFEIEKQYSPFDLTELYYEKILDKLDTSICLLKYWISEHNEVSIILFKKWFINNFAEEYEESNYFKYDWSSSFCQKIMNITLTHLEEDYSIHEVGGSYEFFFEKMKFLHEVAIQPFEIELFELVEGNFELFVDED